jgi:hypothetical protein
MKIQIPIEFLPFFKENPDRATLEYLSVPAGSTNPFFRNPEKIVEAMQRGSKHSNPIDEATYQFDSGFRTKDHIPRYMHIDLAINRDAVGISMCHAAGFETRKVGNKELSLPRITFDFVGRLIPRTEFGEKEVNYNAIQDLVDELAFKRKFNLEEGLITFDRFQSHMLITNIRGMGIPCGLLSVDRTATRVLVDFKSDGYIRRESVPKEPSAAMGALRDAAYQDRLEFPQMSMADEYRTWIEKEVDECQWDADKQKAVKIEGGSDDVLQAAAGAAYNCTNNACLTHVPEDLRHEEQMAEERFYDEIGRNAPLSEERKVNRDGYVEDGFSAYQDRQPMGPTELRTESPYGRQW